MAEVQNHHSGHGPTRCGLGRANAPVELENHVLAVAVRGVLNALAVKLARRVIEVLPHHVGHDGPGRCRGRSCIRRSGRSSCVRCRCRLRNSLRRLGHRLCTYNSRARRTRTRCIGCVVRTPARRQTKRSNPRNDASKNPTPHSPCSLPFLSTRAPGRQRQEDNQTPSRSHQGCPLVKSRRQGRCRTPHRDRIRARTAAFATIDQQKCWYRGGRRMAAWTPTRR